MSASSVSRIGCDNVVYLTLLVAYCYGLPPANVLVGGIQVPVQRRHFILGVHKPDEKVLEIVGASASWYEGHPVEREIQYPSSDGAPGEFGRLSCVGVILIYATTRIPDAALVDPRVHFIAGGLAHSFAEVSIWVPHATFINYTSVFYGFR